MTDRKYFPVATEEKKPAASGTSPNDFQVRKKVKVIWPIEELEEWFKGKKLPAAPINLPGTTMKIVNTERFLESHISTIKKHNGNKLYTPDWERLLIFKKLIENES